MRVVVSSDICVFGLGIRHGPIAAAGVVHDKITWDLLSNVGNAAYSKDNITGKIQTG